MAGGGEVLLFGFAVGLIAVAMVSWYLAKKRMTSVYSER